MPRKNGRNARPIHAETFREVCEGSRGKANRALFVRASLANRLAKCENGSTKRQLYLIKNRCIDQLINRGNVLVDVDRDFQVGLLSVGIADLGRLHTHEGWLNEARATYGCK